LHGFLAGSRVCGWRLFINLLLRGTAPYLTQGGWLFGPLSRAFVCHTRLNLFAFVVSVRPKAKQAQRTRRTRRKKKRPTAAAAAPQKQNKSDRARENDIHDVLVLVRKNECDIYVITILKTRARMHRSLN
jgi:hypothetical protein